MTAVLTLGTASNRVDLLDVQSGFWLDEWEPTSISFKETWVNSPLAEGRRLRDRKLGNAIETMLFKVRGKHMNELARQLALGVQKRENGALYWTKNWQNEPIYLEAKGFCETGTRYAVINSILLGPINDPYGQPIYSPYDFSITDGFQMTLERNPWTDVAPGSSTCVELSATQVYGGVTETTLTSSPTASEDDGFRLGDQGSLGLGGTNLAIGQEPVTTTSTTTCIRFPGITIPKDATIISASIQFESAFNDAATNARAIIYGEATDNPVSFTDMWEMMERPRTSAFVNWPDTEGGIGAASIEAWVAGTDYQTPDITGIVQELVNRAGWTSNNAMVFFMEDDNSDTTAGRRPASFDNATRAAPILTIVYTTTDTSFGRDATCDDEVYIGNKHNRANISDVYRQDGGAWSANLRGATPYNLFVAGVANNDAAYFGIDTTLSNSGPFCSLIFDLDDVLAYAGDASITWEYYNGAAWAGLTVVDRTIDGFGANAPGPFTKPGVNSVVWEQPATWATVNLLADLGGGAPNVTGYWIRARATIGGGDSITGPAEQQNRDIYTAVVPFVDIDEAQLNGDFPALIKFKFHNKSDELNVAPDMYAHRVIVSSRKVSRGNDFTPYLNWSDEQNTPGADAFAVAGTVAFDTDVTTATGRRMTWTPAGAVATMTNLSLMRLRRSLAFQYYGRFRVFLRCQQVGGSVGNIKVRLRFLFGQGGIDTFTDTKQFQNTGEIEVLDFGLIDIPGGGLSTTDRTDLSQVNVQGTASGAGPVLRLYELILMPTDEWIGEFVAAQKNSFSKNLGAFKRLIVDSATKPKDIIRTYVEWTDVFTGILAIWLSRGPAPAQVFPGENQRLWFLVTRETSAENPVCEPWAVHSVQLFKVQRYNYLRGTS